MYKKGYNLLTKQIKRISINKRFHISNRFQEIDVINSKLDLKSDLYTVR